MSLTGDAASRSGGAGERTALLIGRQTNSCRRSTKGRVRYNRRPGRGGVVRAVMVMYDTLSRVFLPPYGNDWVVAPNFTRLAECAVTFDNCYAGSMPCIPARR